MNKLLAAVAMALVLPAVASAQGSARGQQKREENHRRLVAAQAQRNEDQAARNAARARRENLRAAWIPTRPMVQRDGTRWVAPVYSRTELRLAQPWQAGRFTRGTGPLYVWQLEGGDRERFNLGGQYFALAPADYNRAANWNLANDQVVLYPDGEHAGWYLAYNPRLGTYTHVRYLGN